MMGLCGLNYSGSEAGQVAACCENINENLAFMKYVEFLDTLRNLILKDNFDSSIHLRSSILRNVTQRRVGSKYRRFGTT